MFTWRSPQAQAEPLVLSEAFSQPCGYAFEQQRVQRRQRGEEFCVTQKRFPKTQSKLSKLRLGLTNPPVGRSKFLLGQWLSGKRPCRSNGRPNGFYSNAFL